MNNIFSSIFNMNNIENIENVNEYDNQYTEELMQEDVMDEDTLDDWSLDDFFAAIPKTIEDDRDNICTFHLWYSYESNQWNAAYDTPWGDHLLESSNIDKYELFKEIYFKLKKL